MKWKNDLIKKGFRKPHPLSPLHFMSKIPPTAVIENPVGGGEKGDGGEVKRIKLCFPGI